MRWRVAVLLGLSIVSAESGSSAARLARSAPATEPFLGALDPRDLDLADLVPAAGRLDYVWYVPAGRTVPQVAVAWQFHDSRRVLGWDDARRYVLTLWSPTRRTRASARWVPQT